MKREKSFKHIKYRLRVLGLFLFSMVLLISCNRQDKSTVHKVYSKIENLDKECEYSLKVGENISDTAFSEDAIEKGPFGLVYNIDFLKKIFKSSAESTLNFAHSLGIKTLRVEKSQSNCQMFYFLDEAQEELLDIWKRYTKVEQKGQRTFVPNGLYFSMSQSNLSLPVDPVVFLKSDANRWTLVHELMHYNFHRTELQVYGFSEIKTREDNYFLAKEILDRNFQNYVKHRDLEYLKILLDSIVSVMDSLDKYLFMSRTQVDEISIEYILIKSYLKGQLTYVPNNLLDSYSYIVGNAKGIFEQFIYPIKNIIDQYLIEDSKIYYEYEDKVKHLSERIDEYPVLFDNILTKVRKSIALGKWVEE